jgi:hypothetical protein
VNCILENLRFKTFPIVLTSWVFPRPGIPSKRTFPPEKIAINTSLTISSCPIIPFPISLLHFSNFFTTSFINSSFIFIIIFSTRIYYISYPLTKGHPLQYKFFNYSTNVIFFSIFHQIILLTA